MLLKYVIEALNRKKVPFMVKTDFTVTNPQPELMKVKLTKPDRFYRANGKVISKNLAAILIRMKVVYV